MGLPWEEIPQVTWDPGLLKLVLVREFRAGREVPIHPEGRWIRFAGSAKRQGLSWPGLLDEARGEAGGPGGSGVSAREGSGRLGP